MGERFGGRKAGTPNKSTGRLKAFLDEVFEEALARPEMKQRLVDEIASLKLDTRLLATLLQYYAGRPPQALDHRVEGTLSLAQLIVGEDAADPEDAQEPEE